MKIVDNFDNTRPIRKRNPKNALGLTIPQLRVLKVLASCRGPISRRVIAERIGNSQINVGKALGRSDPTKRTAFEQTKDGGFRPSLLTLGYVKETEVQVEEGLLETCIELTKAGRKAFMSLGPIDLPPVRN